MAKNRIADHLSSRLPLRLGLGLGLVMLLAACSDSPRISPNVVFVSIDTLRADRLGCYGYSRDTSPHLDALAAESARYDKAYTTSAWTLPTHVSLLSGRHHVQVGVETVDNWVPESTPMLAEYFAKESYQTAAFVDSAERGFVGGERGFARGFDEYHHAPHRSDLRFKYDTAVTVDVAVEWLNQRDVTRPFFLFLHTKSVHTVANNTKRSDHRHFPYDKPDPYRFRYVSDERASYPWKEPRWGSGTKYLTTLNRLFREGTEEPEAFPAERLEVLSAMYDGGIHYVDEQLGRFRQQLDRLGLAQNTILVVTADHGEAFLEHDQFMHVELFDEVLRVPLIVHAPSLTPRVLPQPVSVSQIPATLLQLAGIPHPDIDDGPAPPSLSPPLPREPQTSSPPLYAQTSSQHGYRSIAMLDGDWKLVAHNYRQNQGLHFQLFQLADDPHERHPVANESQKAKMREDLLRWLKEQRPAQRTQRELDEATRSHLKSLGYLDDAKAGEEDGP